MVSELVLNVVEETGLGWAERRKAVSDYSPTALICVGQMKYSTKLLRTVLKPIGCES